MAIAPRGVVFPPPSSSSSLRFFLVLLQVVVGLKNGPRPLAPGTAIERYPASDVCSRCGLCETKHIGRVKEACAFLGEGWSRTGDFEEKTHGRRRDLSDEDELYFGVYDDLFYAKKSEPRPAKAAWTGIVTSIAAAALEKNIVDCVIGVGRVGEGPFERMTPQPVLCRTKEEVLESCPGVKPVLSNTLSVFERLDPSRDRRVLFLGVGCQVQALRAIESDLDIDALYILGTCCADNVRSPEALERFLRAVSASPETAVGFEFTADYAVSLKHVDGVPYESVPVFSLPTTKDLKDVIAPSCYSCFDYVNALADVIVGYMAVPDQGTVMTNHDQFLIVRNNKGKELVDLIDLHKGPVASKKGASRLGFAEQITEQDLDGVFLPPKTSIWSLPTFIAKLAAKLLTSFGPSGIEFAKNSIDYHQLRNAVYLQTIDSRRSRQNSRNIIPDHAQTIEARYYPGFTDRLIRKYEDHKKKTKLP